MLAFMKDETYHVNQQELIYFFQQISRNYSHSVDTEGRNYSPYENGKSVTTCEVISRRCFAPAIAYVQASSLIFHKEPNGSGFTAVEESEYNFSYFPNFGNPLPHASHYLARIFYEFGQSLFKLSKFDKNN